MSKRRVAEEIVKVIKEKTDITKNKLIEEVCKRQRIGSSTVRELLSQLYILDVVRFKVIQRAHVHFVNEEKLGELEKISDQDGDGS